MVRLPGNKNEPGKLRAALFALLVHAAFLALLVFGLNWKNEAPEAMSVDLWADLPQRPIKPVSPVAQVTSQPEPAKPQSRPQQKTQPQPQPVIKATPPPVRKPEIALKDKTEKPQPKEEVKKLEPVKKEVSKEEPAKKPVEKPASKEEVKKPELVKKEAPKTESIKKVEQKTEKKDDARQQAEAQKQDQQREQQMAAAKAAQARALGEIEKYKAMIQAKIRSRIIMPPDLPGNPAVEFMVTLLPGGDVLTVTLRKSSSYTAFDEAVERAIYLAKPLPLPPDPGLFNEFRNLNITVYYRE
ncbi:cell envelope integrity protein TolA [Nitrosomonas eutropha]|uniref:Cell division and transport-associated protein TolA n=2 Tax=Nitrosomonas eutropha TaxID=916 RepID=A0ABX5M9I4_9PROT|nr:cell envelope integrity protein TolA [Nitrosomonas eutropha]ABI58572.1 Cell division and transport-associated protein TolA [Nitrosomonas eutropha C91]PXV82367.1 cell division and transport-associated protein TolA [Nitrosomonas eutropha]SEI66982.1 Cell division and transport-associated protein TolA [Nitrosomonas eutropha]